MNFVWCTLYSFSNYKFQNYLMVGNIHRNQHNAKINMFWNFSAPFISPFLHPNFAIRLISSWNQHFLNETCIEQLNTLYLRNPILRSGRLRMQVSQQILLLHESTTNIEKRKLYSLLTCIWVLSGAKTTMVLLSIPICEVK